MKPPRKRARDGGEVSEPPPETEERAEELFKDGSEICQQLMDRYAKSSAAHHRHLLATAAATRAILTAESLPLTPSYYFASAMANLESASSSAKTLSSTEIAGLMSFLVLVIPAVPPRGIAAPKAREAVEVLVRVVMNQDGEDSLGVSTVRSAVKCLGALLGFCEVEDWDSVKLGFETLLKFSVDKRPKVRRGAQECLENAFKLFQSSPSVVKKASKLVFSLLQNYIPLAVKLTSCPVADEPKDETKSKPGQIEVLHMLNVVTFALPSLSPEVRLKILPEVRKLLSPQFSILMRHIHKIIESFLRNLKVGDALQETEDIIVSVCSYVTSSGNPVDTVISAANLLKLAMDKLQTEGSESRMKNMPLVCRSLAGLLTSSDTASQASNILKELINSHVDEKTLLINDQLPEGKDESTWSFEARAMKATCAALENVFEEFKGIPSEHYLDTISAMFLKLGGCSCTYMEIILLKLADLMINGSGEASGTDYLQRCIGSAVVAIGPEKMLSLFPISLHAEDFSYTNLWLVPILKEYVVGSSLNYYMEHIVPLAKSFQQASRKAGKSLLGNNLKKHAHDLWKLLTAFCRHPADTYKQFSRLAKLLSALLKKYSFMKESVALALKILVEENRSILSPEKEGLVHSYSGKEFMELHNIQPYSAKTARKNMKAIASSSTELLQILSDLFINSTSGKRLLLKDAIGCLACIIDSSLTKEIFISSIGKCDVLTDGGESNSDASPDGKQENMGPPNKNIQRCVVVELASCLVAGADPELIESIFDFVKQTFEETNDVGHGEAYHALRRILEEHDGFCSSHYAELLDLLLGLRTPTDVAVLNGRFACLHILMVHILEMNLEQENKKAFLILNEIILTLKNANEEARKAAYDILLGISSSLKSTLYQKFISMIMGYLSGSSPQISSGAVSALSVLLHKDTDICLSVPELVPSLLSLLQSKALELIKAVLGFVKVLVSCAPTRDLQDLLSEIVVAVLPWSSVSRHHFREKVIVILEILIRKCGFAAVQSVVPDKFKKFIKKVLEDKQNRGSKEAGTVDTDTPTGSHITGPHKRKHNTSSNVHDGDAPGEHKRRKREWKDNDNRPNSRFGRKAIPKGSQNAGTSDGKMFNARQRNEGAKSGNRNFRGATSENHWKRKPGNMNKKFDGNPKKDGASKFNKHKKFGRSPQGKGTRPG